jgi:hypothetical protein
LSRARAHERPLRAKLDALESRLVALQKSAPQPGAVAALHPKLAEVYAAKVADLKQSIAAGDVPEALEIARALIDKGTIHPSDGGGGPPGIELGRIAEGRESALQTTAYNGLAFRHERNPP